MWHNLDSAIKLICHLKSLRWFHLISSVKPTLVSFGALSPTCFFSEGSYFPSCTSCFILSLEKYLYCREVIKKIPSLAPSGGGCVTLDALSTQGFSVARDKAAAKQRAEAECNWGVCAVLIAACASRSKAYVSSCVCPPHSIKSK